jgi:hypothetical protein
LPRISISAIAQTAAYYKQKESAACIKTKNQALTRLLAVVATKPRRTVAFAIIITTVGEMETFKARKHTVEARRTVRTIAMVASW